MKKLVIMMVAATMAVVANAAATSWTVTASKILSQDGVNYYTSGESAVIMAVLSNSSEAAFQVATVSVSNGKITSPSSDFQSELLLAGNNYDFYFTITDGGKTYKSSVLTGQAAQQSATVTLAFGNQTNAGGSWGSPVPEPTSGLLMLLGMATLALKRKCA